MIQTPHAIIFPPNSEPLGLKYWEWCQKWCEWLLPIPKDSNPTSDESGTLTERSQNFPHVFFLCQTFESPPSTPHRSIRIPDGTFIFMPIINWISVLGGEEKNEQDLKKLAKKMMDEVVKLHLFINGEQAPVNLNEFRVQSPVLKIILPDNNILNVKRGPTSVVVDGFWIFFEPLAKMVSIETYGACRSGKTQIAVKYHISAS